MLWLCFHLSRLPLDAAAVPEGRPFAVCGTDHRVLAANDVAAAHGVRRGQKLDQAFALCPPLQSMARCPQAEQETLEAVAGWAGQFGQPVTLDAGRHLIWVEIGSSLKLFGGLKRLLETCRERQAALSITLQRGIAPGLEASAMLARNGYSRPVLSFARLRTLIEAWPQQRLELPPEARQMFAGTGLRRIGDVLAVPADALARRLGEAVPEQISRLVGERSEAWVTYTPPSRYRRRLDLPCEIEMTEGLRFPLRRLIHEFAGYLHMRDVGVQHFTLRFAHANGRHTPLNISLLAASRDAAKLLRIASERLERQPPTAAVQEIGLEADHFLVPDVAQGDLFGDDRSLLDLRDVLELIAARLGRDAVQQLQVAAEHRPEDAWTSHAWTSHAPDAAHGVVAANVARPLWLLAEPQVIDAPNLKSGPERIEHGWWKTAARRDYFQAEDGEGRRLWVYREADGTQWRLQGYWA